MGRVCQMGHVFRRQAFPNEVSGIFRNLLVNGKRPWCRAPETPRGVLGISSDGDDRMEPKVKTQKNP